MFYTNLAVSLVLQRKSASGTSPRDPHRKVSMYEHRFNLFHKNKCHLGSFGVPLGSFGVPLGHPWAPFGSLWGALDSLWLPLGRLLDFIEKWTSLSEQMLPKYRAGRQNQASRYSPPAAPGCPRLPPEMVSGTAARTPPPHAPGARMT